MEDRIRRAPTLIIVNEQGEEIGSGKGNSHSLWVLSRRLVRMLLKQHGPIALTAAAAVLVGPGGVSDPSKHRSQTQASRSWTAARWWLCCLPAAALATCLLPAWPPLPSVRLLSCVPARRCHTRLRECLNACRCHLRNAFPLLPALVRLHVCLR